MGESQQHWLDRNRPPRVQITYDVETGGAIKSAELPFIMGVLADLAPGAPKGPVTLKQKKFVEIDRDNIFDVLQSANPKISFRAENKLEQDGQPLGVALQFGKLELSAEERGGIIGEIVKQVELAQKQDPMVMFEPISVICQVPKLRELLEARLRLRDLLTKLDGNDDLDTELRNAINDADKRKQLRADLGLPAEQAAAAEAAPAAKGKGKGKADEGAGPAEEPNS